MSDSCIPPEDFGNVDALPGDHLIRVHLANCARCQARWRSYLAFVEDKETFSGARTEEAEAALNATILRQYGFTESPSSPRPIRFPTRWRLRFLILSPVAAVAVAAVLLWGGRDRPEPTHSELRGPSSAAAFHLEGVNFSSDGGFRLCWRALPGADAYRVRVFDTRLNRVLETSAQPETAIVLRPVDFGPSARPGSRFVWRVAALRGGEEIGVSEAGTLSIP